jgi:crotonobetainyl-CoA:carnitine CoA-transferase CaiB-like acyl-CoA transferase
VKYKSAELQRMLEEAGVPYAPLRRPDQLLDDPHLVASGQLLPVPMDGGKIGNLPKLPFASTAYDFTLRRPPPKLGEQTREVLSELGLPAAEIDALFAATVVAQA